MQTTPYICDLNVQVAHPDDEVASDATPCRIGQHITFDADRLQTYQTDGWRPIIYDAMLVAAAVEACDHSRARASMDWGRQFTVSVPVHDPNLWNSPSVQDALVRALKMLMGDNWTFHFTETSTPQQGPLQSHFGFPEQVDAVMPFSDGLDSWAVSTVMDKTRNDRTIRVRVGSNKIERPQPGDAIQPFANVPFKVTRIKSGNGESSGRSRGFKFAMLSGIAAYLVGASRIIVPESGQGALGPVLVNLGQGYFDRRTHPQYTSLMSDFFDALFGIRIEFEHPVLWSTKGESLAVYKSLVAGDEIWKETRSCWKDARHASLNGDHRQCGVCAACMLRRTSLHAAGYNEDPAMYIWENLSADDFWAGAHVDHTNKSNAQRDYAIAGVLHMDHLAALSVADYRDVLIQRQALILAKALGISVQDSAARIARLLEAHADEWRSFVQNLSKSSFIRGWAVAA